MICSLSRRGRLVAAVAAVLMAGTAQANLLTNGSFELGVTPPIGGFKVLSPGNTDLAGWTIGGAEGVDWVPNEYWQAADGNFSLDMNALGIGTVTQSFATVAGGTYTVTYSLSMNPDTNNTFPIPRLLTVAATDTTTNTVVGQSDLIEPFNSFGSQLSPGSMNWQTRTLTFTATGTSTSLSFISGNDYAGGFVLDNVSVEGAGDPAQVPAPAGLLLGLFGAAVGLRFRRRKAVTA